MFHLGDIKLSIIFFFHGMIKSIKGHQTQDSFHKDSDLGTAFPKKAI